MRVEVRNLQDDIDEEIMDILLAHFSDINKRKIDISVSVNAIPLSSEEKKMICNHLGERWIAELKREGVLEETTQCYFILRKVFFRNEYEVKLKLYHLYQ